MNQRLVTRKHAALETSGQTTPEQIALISPLLIQEVLIKATDRLLELPVEALPVRKLQAWDNL